MINYDSASYWWQFIKDEPNVPVTQFVPYDRRGISNLFDGKTAPEYDRLFFEVEGRCQEIGYPCFLRTDITSAKHAGIKAIKVTENGDLNVPLLKTLEHAELKAIHGPALYSNAIMVREWLNLKATFTAFHGLPIATEFRIFADGGNIQCMHPYWPEHALEGYTDKEDWRERLQAMNAVEPPISIQEQAEAISTRLGGAWSLDYALTKDNVWYLTDMATAANSYHQQHQ